MFLLSCNQSVKDTSSFELKQLQIDTSFIKEDSSAPVQYSCEQLCAIFQQCEFLEEW